MTKVERPEKVSPEQPLPDPAWTAQHASLTLKRLLPRLEELFRAPMGAQNWNIFIRRLETHFDKLFAILVNLYGHQYDFFYRLEELLHMAARQYLERPDDLKALDERREAEPDWFQSNQMMGGVCYVDLFAGNLEGIRSKIPYFKELGLTYLHLMPLFKCPEGNSDGGYAVSSYREVNPVLGTMEELAVLSRELRENGISLVVDLIFNHTSDEHAWAQLAMQGEAEFQDYYRTFASREMPDAYERTLREIFPDEHPGAFSYYKEIEKWVWTTFHTFQWDLNYSNPAVFNAMAEELLFLANVGVEVIRLDAVAFVWKRLGTDCESLPEAHFIIRAFNALCRIAAPALLFKSEAIVHPDEVVEYIHPDECQLSYNPLLMALLWNTLATRETNLLSLAMATRFKIHPACSWVNYVRCHDDIGWTFSNEDAAQFGIQGYDHRRFLNDFYTGRFPGSFAAGLPFQENPRTGDCRISGTCASLAGLERGLSESLDSVDVDHALKRILLIHSLILSMGGIPLIYLGDEVGMLNDYTFRSDPAKVDDSRWVHRPFTDWDKVARRNQAGTIEARLFQPLSRLITLRKNNPVLAGGDMDVVRLNNPHVFGFVRSREGSRLLVMANFSEHEQVVSANQVRLAGLSYVYTDLISENPVNLDTDIRLSPYQFMWLLV